MPLSRAFGEFELDGGRYELRRRGHVLKLERIPMELLLLLVERDGQVVSRQEIVDRLWGRDVFVDTEHGINTAVRKIRAVLQDEAERPRFILTVQGKGYRFVAGSPNGHGEAAAAAPPIPAISAAPTPSAARRPAAVLAAACLLAGALLVASRSGIRDRLVGAPRRIRSIAVLPLMNLSGDPAQDYFADGLTDELITMIAKNPTLRVVSRTSAMQYQGVHRPLREIGRELGVDGVLEGSVTRAGNRVHLTVQLVHVESDSDVWAETYDRDFADALSLPTELAQTIAVAVKSATGPAEVRPPVNPEAHDAYLHGLYFWFGEDLPRSIEYFQQAIRLAPDYAAAWSGLADAYIVQAVAVTVPVSQVEAKVREAAHKAVTLDDALSEAHRTLSAVHLFLDWNWEGAEVESERAVALNPGGAEARHLHSYVLLALDRIPESLEEQKRSTELDPFARPWALGYALIHARQFDAAVAELRMRAAVKPQDASLRFMLSDAYRYLGRGKESAQAMEDAFLAAGRKARAEGARRAFDSGGEKGLSEWLLAEGKAAARTRYVSPWTLAEQSAHVHRTEETLKFLEAAYAERSPRLVYLKVEPDFDFLHADDRYRALVRKVGLP